MSFNGTWAKIVGVVLLLVGILGFFMGDTVFGFGVNSLHNIVHLVSGVILLWAGFASAGANAKTANIVFGIVYLVVAIVGFMNVASLVDMLALNWSDNWLHLIIGVVTTAIGLWA